MSEKSWGMLHVLARAYGLNVYWLQYAIAVSPAPSQNEA